MRPFSLAPGELLCHHPQMGEHLATRQKRIRVALASALAEYTLPEDALDAAAAAAARADMHLESEIIAMVEQGCSYSKIRADLGVHPRVIKSVLEERGAETKRTYNVPVEWTEDMKAQLAGMVRSGVKGEEIAKRLGVTLPAINKQKARMGLTQRRR